MDEEEGLGGASIFIVVGYVYTYPPAEYAVVLNMG